MKNLLKFMAEQKSAKSIVVSFGRMNPMTNGHEKLVQKIKSEASKRNADAKLYLSHSTNPKKDPLSFEDKLKFAKKAFGPMVQNSPARTIIEVAKELTGKYSTLVVVVGSDRVPEFTKLLNTYNGKDFTFDSIEVVSAGERDPDAEGVEGMSASKMRKFAADEDLKTFSTGVPSKLSAKDAEQLYNAVRKGMKLQEELEIDEGIQATADFKISKSGKKYPAHKIVLSKEKEDESKEVKKEEFEVVDEAVLSLSQRRKRSMQFKRMQTKIQRARMLAMRKFADKKHLALRSRRQARTALKKRFSPGKDYESMATGQKITIDKRLDKMKPVVGKIAARLLPKVRQAEIRRKMSMGKVQETIQVNEAFTQVFQEATDQSRLDQLIRYGLADKSMLSTIKRSVGKLSTGENLNTSERKSMESLITTLLDMVTSSDALFRMTKTKLQKESVELLEQDDEDINLDGLYMAKIEIATLIDDAEDIMEMLYEIEEEPEAWITSKISLATDYIATVKDYLEFNGSENEAEDDSEDIEDEDESNVEEALLSMSKEDFGEFYEEFEDILEELGGLKKKSEKTGIEYSIIKEVYQRGLNSYDENSNMTAKQWAFARVNSFVSGGQTTKEDDSDLWESTEKNLKFSTFVESALEYGTDAARMAYARATPGQSQEIIDAKYSAEHALEVINNANVQRAYKLYSEEACCDECVEEDISEEVDWDLVLHEAEYQGKDVTLNKPFYTPDGPKKSAVYTMGPNGKVVIVRFGDPNMEIKKDNPERRKSFRARHNCAEPGPKWSAKYWSCAAW